MRFWTKNNQIIDFILFFYLLKKQKLSFYHYYYLFKKTNNACAYTKRWVIWQPPLDSCCRIICPVRRWMPILSACVYAIHHKRAEYFGRTTIWKNFKFHCLTWKGCYTSPYFIEKRLCQLILVMYCFWGV